MSTHIVVYYHPEYWRVQSVEQFPSSEEANAEIAKLRLGGSKILIDCDVSNLIDVFKLGCLADQTNEIESFVLKIMNKLEN